MLALMFIRSCQLVLLVLALLFEENSGLNYLWYVGAGHEEISRRPADNVQVSSYTGTFKVDGTFIGIFSGGPGASDLQLQSCCRARNRRRLHGAHQSTME